MDQPLQIILLDGPPSPRSLAALYAAKHKKRQLAIMCGERGLPSTAPTKRALAERLANAPQWTEELLEARRRDGLSVTLP